MKITRLFILTWTIVVLIVIQENVDRIRCLCWALGICQFVYFLFLLSFFPFFFPRVLSVLYTSVLNLVVLIIRKSIYVNNKINQIYIYNINHKMVKIL